MSGLQQLPRASARASSLRCIHRQRAPNTVNSQNQSPLTRRHLSSTSTNTPQPSSSNDTIPARAPSQPLLDASATFVAHVTRTGTMSHAVQLTRMHQVYNAHLRKHYTKPLRLLAHDPHPTGFLRTGDVVEYSGLTSAERAARAQAQAQREARELEQAQAADGGGVVPGKNVRRVMAARAREARERVGRKTGRGPQVVVRRVVTPFGVALEERHEGSGEVQKALEQSSGGRNKSRKNAKASVS